MCIDNPGALEYVLIILESGIIHLCTRSIKNCICILGAWESASLN